MDLRKLTLVPAMLITATSFAQPPIDSDGDGLISRYEFDQQSAERFARLDTNSDGYLSQEELRAARRGMGGPMGPRGPGRSGGLERAFDTADADGDGRISAAEAEALGPAGSGDRFAMLDTDSDGYITRDELRNLPGAIRERRGELFAQADTDGDGALSLAEIQAVRPGITAEQFSRMDANGDGLLSPDERPGRPRRF